MSMILEADAGYSSKMRAEELEVLEGEVALIKSLAKSLSNQ